MKQHKPLIRNTKNSIPQKSTPTVTVEQSELYSGPIPHPDILRGFAQVDPSFPDRIISMAELHARADVTTENRASLANLITPIIGQIFTFLLGTGGIVSGVILAVKGYTAESISVIVGSFAPIIIAAFANFRTQKK